MTKLPCDHYYMGRKFKKGTLLSDCPSAVQKAVIALNQKTKDVEEVKAPKRPKSEKKGSK